MYWELWQTFNVWSRLYNKLWIRVLIAPKFTIKSIITWWKIWTSSWPFARLVAFLPLNKCRCNSKNLTGHLVLKVFSSEVGTLFLKSQIINILGFVGYKHSVIAAKFCCDDSKVAIDIMKTTESARVPMKLPFEHCAIWIHIISTSQNSNIVLIFPPNHLKDVKRQFLVCGQCKNRQSAGFGLWAMVCWPLNYMKRRVLMKNWKHLLNLNFSRSFCPSPSFL